MNSICSQSYYSTQQKHQLKVSNISSNSDYNNDDKFKEVINKVVKEVINETQPNNNNNNNNDPMRKPSLEMLLRIEEKVKIHVNIIYMDNFN